MDDQRERDSEMGWLLAEHATDQCIFLTDLEGLVSGWNGGAERLFGYAESEIVGRSDDCLSTPEDIQCGAPYDEVRRALAGERAESERWQQRKDGSRFWSSVVAIRLSTSTGQPRGVARIVRDRTESWQQERFRGLMEQAPFSIQVLSTDGRTLQVNRAWEELWGATVDQLAGYNMLEDPQLAAKGIQALLRQAFAGRAVTLPSIEYDPNETIPDHGLVEDRRRWVSAVAYPIKDHSQSVREVILVHQDITAQKLAEQSLRDADRRKDEFLAMLGHELRNPLAPIRSGLELLALEQGSEVIRLMMRQVDHLVRLVDDLLDVSRIMRGKIGLRREPVELAHIIAQAIEISRPVIDGQQHQLTRSLPAEPVWIDGDPVRLAQVFGNLLNNAAKYTPPHGQIWISAETDDDAVMVRIRDNGLGIEPQLLPHIFDLFTQGSRAIDRSQGGLGIGLTVVRSLVEMHGGAVSVHSEGAGGGSEFVVRLPLLAPQQRMQGISDASRVQRGYRILVVDDNEAAATVVKLLLTRLGPNEVTVTHDGPAALEVIDQQRPEVVLLDLGLPGLSGLEVARRLRANPDYANMLLVALTGYGTADDRQSVEAVGFDTHLIKPADMAALQRLFEHPKLAAARKR